MAPAEGGAAEADAEAVAVGALLKAEGNAAYKAERLQHALACYQAALDVMGGARERAGRELAGVCWSNMAACALAEGDFLAAKRSAEVRQGRGKGTELRAGAWRGRRVSC